MTAEQYLEQIQMIDGIIKSKLKDYKYWKDIADELGVGFSVDERVQTTRNLHKGSDAIVEYILIDKEIKALKNKRQGIINTIQSLPYEEYKILYDIFVDRKLLKETPGQFNKSYEWAKWKKQKALDHVQQIIDKKEG